MGSFVVDGVPAAALEGRFDPRSQNVETWKQRPRELLEFGAQLGIGFVDKRVELPLKTWKRGNMGQQAADDLEDGPVVLGLVAAQEVEHVRGLDALRVAEPLEVENQLDVVQCAQFLGSHRVLEALLHGLGVLHQAERVLVHFHPALRRQTLF